MEHLVIVPEIGSHRFIWKGVVHNEVCIFFKHVISDFAYSVALDIHLLVIKRIHSANTIY
jgi:hypothetical protein